VLDYVSFSSSLDIILKFYVNVSRYGHMNREVPCLTSTTTTRQMHLSPCLAKDACYIIHFPVSIGTCSKPVYSRC